MISKESMLLISEAFSSQECHSYPIESHLIAKLLYEILDADTLQEVLYKLDKMEEGFLYSRIQDYKKELEGA